ncbi:proliferating cell nuclear antigen, N-terminal domain-containing protein [Vararia minispora EC-137]|uniref:Proliferating cell nuclear antigen, N-terminal domain-containing protein n=1 Tax=Vararia minispora EC-137 TaxID=1314806 RepID=A0ACB8QGS1_9AGAM|nr:proliferating cell nuclear antigen, N-terminal domain-containing protein [Vararia minispora EC-137]
MLEAKLNEAATLKRLLDSIKELVQDAEFKCDEGGIELQAMDNSHVALVSVKLNADGFRRYRCDRPMPIGVNLNSLTKVLKCAKDDDICTLKATDDSDVLSLTYEARNADRIAEYDMKLMDIDADTLGIPDTEYEARVTMASSEFARIVKDLSNLGESVRIEVSKEGIRFAADGESANGSILLKQTDSARKRYENYNAEDEAVKEEDDDEEESENKKKKRKIKKEADEEDEEDEDDEKAKKKKKAADDEDEPMDEDDGEFKAKSDDEGEEEQSEAEGKKRKKASSANGKPKKRARKSDDDDGPVSGVSITMTAHVALTFSLKYLVNFSKSTSLSDTVQLMLRNDVPLLVSYMFGQGHIRYYLAPKIGDD